MEKLNIEKFGEQVCQYVKAVIEMAAGHILAAIWSTRALPISYALYHVI